MNMLQVSAATDTSGHSVAMTRGVHHLELNTDDMKMTTDFYTEVLGMPLIYATRVPAGLGTGPQNRGNPPFENIRHYFFDMGNDSILAFFEIPKGAKPKGDRDAIAAMQHVSFAVNVESAARLLERLEAHRIPIMGPLEAAPGLMSVYFFDPNGVRLEFSWRPLDGEDIHVLDLMRQYREASIRELRTLSNDPGWVGRMSAAMPE
jgi:catechol 2,3-dioxygenase-like lactoylglutathione lyase family enzyme